MSCLLPYLARGTGLSMALGAWPAGGPHAVISWTNSLGAGLDSVICGSACGGKAAALHTTLRRKVCEFPTFVRLRFSAAYGQLQLAM